MEYVTLNNKLECPAVGIGTFMLSPADAENSVREALKMGYRLVDTANAYVNERAVGRGMNDSGVKRDEIFLSTKLWPSEYENPNAVDETLERLGVDYVDLLYIHQPAGNWLEGYRQLEKAYKEGKAKSIGISNFEGKYIEELETKWEIAPQFVQVEAHPYFTQKELRKTLTFSHEVHKVNVFYTVALLKERIGSGNIFRVIVFYRFKRFVFAVFRIFGQCYCICDLDIGITHSRRCRGGHTDWANSRKPLLKEKGSGFLLLLDGFLI